MRIKELIADLEKRQAQKDDGVIKLRGEGVELDEVIWRFIRYEKISW